jgi:hypothetical protein
MPSRETRVEARLERLKGVNQRITPILLPETLVSDVDGIYFGREGIAERLPGKQTKVKLAQPVLSIYQINTTTVLVQTLTDLYIGPVSDFTT